jgi:type IX secretion system PorP/SprF family membrane protein
MFLANDLPLSQWMAWVGASAGLCIGKMEIGVGKALGQLKLVMRKGLVIAGFMMWACAGIWAQHHPMYSQYMFNQMVINPAYAGSRDVLSATALYRHQWAGFKGAPRTQSFFFHAPLPNPRNNFGLSMVMDRLGVTYRNTVQISYAYRFDLGPGRLAFGLQGGLSSLQHRYQDVETDVSGDAVFQGATRPILIPGVGFGCYYDAPRWYLGISAPYLLEYQGAGFDVFMNSDSSAYKPTMLAAGWLIRLNPDLMLRPSTLVKFIPHSPVQVDLNANLIIKEALWLGASYRTGDAIVGMLEYQINHQLRLGYSYDYGLNALQRYHQGSHEFLLRYEFGYRVKAMSPRYF